MSISATLLVPKSVNRQDFSPGPLITLSGFATTDTQEIPLKIRAPARRWTRRATLALVAAEQPEQPELKRAAFAAEIPIARFHENDRP